MLLNGVVVLLQCYFLLMNLTVENCYCNGPFLENDTRFLMKETLEFSQQYNRLFLERPDCMVSAYIFPFFYALIAVAALTNSWRRLSLPILLFIGAKLNAIGFYHYMEFTSSVPPENLYVYFSVEGPYLVSIAIVLVKVMAAMRTPKGDKTN